MAKVTSGGHEITVEVEAALKTFDFWLRGNSLVRRRRPGPKLERLVDKRWIGIPSPARLNSKNWEDLDEKDLVGHLRFYVLQGLMTKRLRWREAPRERACRAALWRWIAPPLDGGAGVEMDDEAIERSEAACSERLSGAQGDDLIELRDEALQGYLRQEVRCAGIDQRANFFLGAAGLTTSLVLANAGLLLGTDKLNAPWLGLGVGALAVASVCTLFAGLRALQATMTTFSRFAPNSVRCISDRAALKGDALVRAYVGALAIAQQREWTVGDWKLKRLRAARRWFLAAIVGVGLLTACVLMDVGQDEPSKSASAGSMVVFGGAQPGAMSSGVDRQ